MKQFASNCSFRVWSQNGTFSAVGGSPPFKLHQMTVFFKKYCVMNQKTEKARHISVNVSLMEVNDQVKG